MLLVVVVGGSSLSFADVRLPFAVACCLLVGVDCCCMLLFVDVRLYVVVCC